MIAFFIRFSGIVWLIRNWFFRKKVAIIVFHNPSVQSMKNHLAYLSRHYQFIELQTFIDAVETKKTNHLPAKSLVLTMDDGHAGNYHLLPLFRQYRIRPTIYLSSHLIDIRCPFNIKKPTLRRDEIKEMQPWCDFQSHGRFHFSLPKCDDHKAWEEISLSKKIIEEILDKPCQHFAYPFGDYSCRETGYVKKCGYKSGRTTDPGWNDRTSDLFRLKVVAMIPDNASRNMLCAHLTGLPLLMEYFMRGVGKGFKNNKQLECR